MVPPSSLAQTPLLGRDLPLAIRQQWPRGSLQEVQILGGHEYKIDIIRADLSRQAANLVKEGHLKLDARSINHLACLASEGERNDNPRYETSQKDGSRILIASNYWRAKHLGDFPAAMDYVARMLSEPVKNWEEPLKPSKQFLKLAERLKQLEIAGHPIILTPVLSKYEASVTEENELAGIHHNAIPRAMAIVMKKALAEAGVKSSIQGDDGRNIFYKMYNVGRTKAGRAERITHQPNFLGVEGVQPGASYLILDDHLTAGASIAQLASAIIEHGGKVTGALSLAKGQNNSAKMLPNKEMLTLMEHMFSREKFGFLHEKMFGSGLIYSDGKINPYSCRFTNGELEILFELACSHSNYELLCKSRNIEAVYDVPGEVPIHRIRGSLEKNPAGTGIAYYFFKELIRTLDMALEKSYAPPQPDVQSIGELRDIGVGMVQERMTISRPKDVREAVKWMLDPTSLVDPAPNTAIGVLTNDICMRLGQQNFDTLTRLIYEIEDPNDAVWTKRQLAGLSFALDSVDLHAIQNRPSGLPISQAAIVTDARTQEGLLAGGIASEKMFTVVWREIQDHIAARRMEAEDLHRTTGEPLEGVVDWQMPIPRAVRTAALMQQGGAVGPSEDVAKPGEDESGPGAMPGVVAAQKAPVGHNAGVGAPK